MARSIPILVGPTASGKTALALRLAERVPDLEVVSADSRQVYRMLAIGTAKPTHAERKAVPHHLIDFLDPAERYSAGRFRTDAEEAIADCLRRGAFPVVVGGTGLYLRALTEGLSPIPAVPDEVNRRLRDALEAEGLPALYRRLQDRDPVAAFGIRPNDTQRILRALAVYEATGKPLSVWWKSPAVPSGYRYAWLGIRSPQERLRDRIRRRAYAMLDAGLEDEVRRLLERGYGWDTPAMRTVGYREWRSHFEGGTSVEEIASRIITDTAQYGKRQMTWFKAVEQVHWVDGVGEDLAEVALEWLESVRTS